MRRGSTFGIQRSTPGGERSSGCVKLTYASSKVTTRFCASCSITARPRYSFRTGDFEEVFRNAETARDGQYKLQLISQGDARELYIARQGRFNVEGYVGYESLARSLDTKRLREARDLTHSQVQTLLGGIGHSKGYDVCVPANDVGKLDWSLTKRFALRRSIPAGFEPIHDILSEIDIVWVARGREAITGLFEVEHSTPVYSGLLRFNDILLTEPKLSRFSIVSNDTRRAIFVRQLCRPTFRKSGLSELTSFLEYANVVDWHGRVIKGDVDEQD